MERAPELADRQFTITSETAAQGRSRSLWQRLLGNGWLPVRVINAILVVGSIGFVLPLFLPYVSQWERNSAFADHHRTGRTFGFQEIGAWLSVLFGVLVVIGLFLGSSPNIKMRIVGKVLALVLVFFGFMLTIYYFFDLSNAGAGAGTQDRGEVGFEIGADILGIMAISYLVSIPLKLVGKWLVGKRRVSQ